MGNILSASTQNQHGDLSIADQHDNQFIQNYSDNMTVVVNTLKTTVAIEVKRLNTIMEVKSKIYDKEEIPIQQQILVHHHCVLNNCFTLCDYDIDDNAVLDLVLKCNTIHEDMYDTYKDCLQPDLHLYLTNGRETLLSLTVNPLCKVKDFMNIIRHHFIRNIPECHPIYNNHFHGGFRLIGGACEFYYNDESCTLSDCNIHHGQTFFVTLTTCGGAGLDDCLSHCHKCNQLPPCPVVINCFNRGFIQAKYTSEYLLLALFDVFNVSVNLKQKIKDNSEDTVVRCIDVLHHIFHADPTHTWSIIKLKLSSKYAT